MSTTNFELKPAKPMTTRRKLKNERSKETIKSASPSDGDSSEDNIYDFMDGAATKAIKRNKENKRPNRSAPRAEKEDQEKRNIDESFKSGQSKGSHMQTRRRNKK